MPPESRLVHPAVGAALAARNAVAAEMAVAGRSRMDPSEACWAAAAQALEDRQAAPSERALSTLQVSVQKVSAPRKSRGRELAEMACWFAVGGVGGLVVLAVVRMVPPVLGW